MSEYALKHGECLAVLKTYPDNSIDCCVTDPPYGISFMGKKWDYEVPSVEIWKEVLRVLKPGGYLLSFAGTRTQHRMAVNIEDAGFEIRDMIAWVYGQGFPKSHNTGLRIDKLLGHANRGHRIAVANRRHPDGTVEPNGESLEAYQAKTPEGARYEGWGTALKPAMEPITMARKPLEGIVAANVLAHGTGAINIDGCRVETQDKLGGGAEKETTPEQKGNDGWCRPWMEDAQAREAHAARVRDNVQKAQNLGRFPANLIHDGSEEVLEQFPASAGQQGDLAPQNKTYESPSGCFGTQSPKKEAIARNDSGSAARFFYCAKASKKDREEGNDHPTVKPTDLMRYLCRLVCPPEGIVLDPFMGSGSTGKAALLEGFAFIGIERESQYIEIAKRRILS